jgi:hypothetical protein
MPEDMKFELLTHPRMRHFELTDKKINSMWGIPLTFVDNWTRSPRSYTLTYRER